MPVRNALISRRPGRQAGRGDEFGRALWEKAAAVGARVCLSGWRAGNGKGFCCCVAPGAVANRVGLAAQVTRMMTIDEVEGGGPGDGSGRDGGLRA